MIRVGLRNRFKWGEKHGAGDGIRTRDINLGKVALYQLSYSRASLTFIVAQVQNDCQIFGIVERAHRLNSLDWRVRALVGRRPFR